LGLFGNSVPFPIFARLIAFALMDNFNLQKQQALFKVFQQYQLQSLEGILMSKDILTQVTPL
jgi:hypothetical protein